MSNDKQLSWQVKKTFLAYAVFAYVTRYGTLDNESIVRLYKLYLKMNPRTVLYTVLDGYGTFSRKKKAIYPPGYGSCICIRIFSKEYLLHRTKVCDFHNLMGFTSKKMLYIILKMFVNKVFRLVKPFLANLHSTNFSKILTCFKSVENIGKRAPRKKLFAKNFRKLVVYKRTNSNFEPLFCL